MRVRQLLFLCGLLASASVGFAQSSTPPANGAGAPPAPIDSTIEARYAIALTAGALMESTEASSPERGEFVPGDVMLYYGETTDSFGRMWSVVGDPAAWSRRDSWYALPTGGVSGALDEGVVSLIRGWSASPPLGARLAEGMDAQAAIVEASLPIAVGREWWRDTAEIEAAYLPEITGLAAVQAYRVTPEVAADALALIGGREALGPWPQAPGRGRLHMAPLLPLVFRFDGERWYLDERPLLGSPTIGLLGNPEMALDHQGPAEETGPPLTCWQLVGAYDPTGGVVGRLETPPEPPERLASAVRPDNSQFLGLTDRGNGLWPVAPETLTAPRRVVPEDSGAGVVLSDASRRQAVYLQQSLPRETVHRLRERTVRLAVWARALPEGEETVSTTVSIEIEVGSVRQVTSGAVGALPTRLEAFAVVPPDAETITVRLLPVDQSVAVTEGGSAVFDRAVLAPATWPVLAEPSAIYLNRVRSTSYAPARRFTRARLAVSTRSPEQLREAWAAVEAGAWDEAARERILSGRLAPGMSGEEVEIAWGQPRSRSATGTLERWQWDDRTAAFSPDGDLLAWQQRSEPRLPKLPVCPSGVP